VPYFLDGNNLIGLARKKSRPGEDDRRALVSELSDRLRQTRSSVRLFFDGPAGRTTSLGRLTVIDAGGSADETIVREVRGTADAGQVTVVTADRELARRVRDVGAKTMSPDIFWSRFAKGAAEAPPGPGGNDRVDVDEWLDYFSDPANRK
jgi:predicted RNA-binding protein with PIN domain